MGFLGNLILKIKGDNKDLKKKLTGSKKEVNSFGNSVKKLGGMLAAAFSIRIIAQWTKSLAKAYDTQIKAEKLLGAAIQSNGGDRERALADYKEWASEMQRISTVGDESTLRLLQIAESMGVTGENAKMAAKEAISLGKAMGMSEQSAIRYTVALQQGNATMLKRYLPSLYEVDSEAEMAAKAHELLANMFSQVTEEAKAGLGPAKQLANSWGDLQETLGGLIVDGKTFTGVMTELRREIERFNAQIQANQTLKESQFIKEELKWWQKAGLWMSRFTKEGREARAIMAEVAVAMDSQKEGIEDGTDATIEQVTTLNSLNAEIKAYQELLSETNIADKNEIKNIYEKIAALEKQKKAIENLSVARTPSVTVSAISTGDMPQGLSLPGLDNNLLEMQTNNAESIINDFTQTAQGMFQQLGTTVVDSLGSIFYAIGSGDWSNFGKSALEGFGNFLKMMGSLVLAYGMAMLKVETALLDPVGAIIAGASAIAIGSLIAGAASRANKSIAGGGGSGGYSSGGRASSTPQNLIIEVQGTLKGSDIAISSRRYSDNVSNIT